jgi:VanZ family protein
MPRLARLLWLWLPVLVWMALILSLSSRSDLPMRTNPQTGETIRSTFAAAKLAHVVEYSVLSLLLLRALIGAGGGLRLSLVPAIVVTVLVCGVFGGLDELRQSFVPTREPRLTDIALDTASALIAALLFAAWQRLRRPKQASQSIASTPPLAPPLPRQGEGVGG